jgi:HlyD family secretion protein
MKFRLVSALVVAASLLVAIWIVAQEFQPSEQTVIPLAPVRQGQFVAVIQTRGQIQAGRSVPVYAPLAPDLRISWMAPTAEMIRRGDPMIRFDSSTAQTDLIERRTAVEEARAKLDEAYVEIELNEQHDARDRVDRQLGVEVARLRTADSEFVGRLEAEQGAIDLRVAEQKQRQLEAEIAQRQVSNEARIASLERQLEQAEAEVAMMESRISGMEIRAPIDGFPIYVTTSSSLAAALGGGGQAPLRVGDQVSSGRSLATIPDLSSMLIDVSVEEIDRGRIQVGDEVIVRVDALPELSIETTLARISPLAEQSSDARTRKFHVQALLGKDVDSRIRPGMNGSMDIVTERIAEALVIPAQALFARNGKPTLYAREGQSFRAIEVEVLAQNPNEVAVRGIDPGARVALVDPSLVPATLAREESRP